MKKLLIALCWVLAVVLAVEANAQSLLGSGKPLAGGGEKHYAPLSIRGVYNQYPVGYAYLKGAHHTLAVFGFEGRYGRFERAVCGALPLHDRGWTSGFHPPQED
ncbi:MAG: hypothetical protein IJ028_07375 [Alistipes sp.]|nr:hypothetical protein [Alistipes sp.]